VGVEAAGAGVAVGPLHSVCEVWARGWYFRQVRLSYVCWLLHTQEHCSAVLQGSNQ